MVSVLVAIFFVAVFDTLQVRIYIFFLKFKVDLIRGKNGGLNGKDRFFVLKKTKTLIYLKLHMFYKNARE